MVYIKRLELRGFKSFGPKKVVMTLDKGLTVITGPNGSGKSNIMDAIRFVLGESSIRSLRASKVSEVIFDGAPNIGKSKSARVSIRLDNADRRIPIDADVVTISREVKENGQSVYRVNGKQISRSKLTEMLSLAGISSSGYNMILQGTITKLADMSPQDRRKMIEELVGIAQYDANKAKAQEQLKEADINLKIASARIDEVQKRLESLEKERNDALRCAFIQREIEKFQVAILSRRISELDGELRRLKFKLNDRVTDVEKIREKLAQLRLKRRSIESERRVFDEEIADKGRVEFIKIQKRIGDLNAQIAASKAEMETALKSLSRLSDARSKYLQRLKTLKNGARKSRSELEKLRKKCADLELNLREKERAHESIVIKLNEARQSLSTRASKIKEIDAKIEDLNRKIIRIDNRLINSSDKIKFLNEVVASFKKRKRAFEATLRNLVGVLEKLKSLKQKELERRSSLLQILKDISVKGKNIEEAVVHAQMVANKARNLIVEYAVKRDLAEKIHAGGEAIRKIEEAGRAGAIQGILGRLKDLIKVDSKYKKAIYAASAGWLEALVVRDMDSALKCIDLLKKMGSGRIKIIPIKWFSRVKALEAPDMDGVIGLASHLVECDERYAPAVNFVFGDTIITESQKSALSVSKAGYRAVDLDGELYEPYGGIEGGCDVQDLSFLTPLSEDVIKNLKEGIKKLEFELDQRKLTVETLKNRMNRLNAEAAHRSYYIDKIDGEMKIINQNISCINANIEVLSENIRKFLMRIRQEKEVESTLKTKMSLIKKDLSQLNLQRRALSSKSLLSSIKRYEDIEAKLSNEVRLLQRKLTEAKSNYLLVESSLNDVLKPELEKTEIYVKALDGQIAALKDKVINLRSTLNSSSKELLKLTKLRDALVKGMASVRSKRKWFEDQLDRLDAQLKDVNSIYESKLGDLHKLRLEIQRRNAEIDHLREELKRLGHHHPIEVKEADLKDFERRLSKARSELEKLGFINQLAIKEYDIQKENYKQLSIRRNQLEKEKRSILRFIEEIEKEKRKAFMNSYRQINFHFKSFFSKLTGGTGSLEIQRPEDPFSGGLDIFVQFPGKSLRLVSGTSGGEKSVAAISFIFAIQSLFPAPFYVFDEIDMHLDPYNAEKLADLVAEQSEGSQFLVITLRDVMIKKAARVFGVYNQGGLSRIVSIKI